MYIKRYYKHMVDDAWWLAVSCLYKSWSNGCTGVKLGVTKCCYSVYTILTYTYTYIYIYIYISSPFLSIFSLSLFYLLTSYFSHFPLLSSFLLLFFFFSSFLIQNLSEWINGTYKVYLIFPTHDVILKTNTDLVIKRPLLPWYTDFP